MTNRRTLLIAIGLAPFAAPLGALAQQQGRVWRVGFLALRRIGPLDSDFFGEFPRGMRELGYVEGKNLAIEWRSAEGKVERLPSLAAELIQQRVDVLVAAGAQAVSAAQKATRTIPIVMGTTGDPVGSGFVKSLARPGGNITGLSDISSDVSPKLLELLMSTVPRLSHVAVLLNPGNSSHVTLLKSIQAAAQGAGVKVTPVMARTPEEIDQAFSMMAREGAKAVIAAADALFNQQSRQIAESAAKHRLPAISGFWQYVEAGGLMSYGQDFANNFRRAAVYVDKIFKGAKPGDLPVEQPTKVILLVNRRTAKALGLALPPDLLLRADRVIE
ncbi:MAG: ABC transporter substrate-binding protein [Burkholderiales bacterium]|nr:ABC transporter substrate-binding protein [Burkholderiales bacterium]